MLLINIAIMVPGNNSYPFSFYKQGSKFPLPGENSLSNESCVMSPLITKWSQSIFWILSTRSFALFIGNSLARRTNKFAAPKILFALQSLNF
ncbi:MAG: hypothetical protein CM1200mP30_24760 [Pseudomonadota bacterium]|nr:MAG: hypothetical protein CM1200mP30_24760 [Pseudomonadota bacterium]